MSFSGTLLLGSNGLDFSKIDANAPETKWGYAGKQISNNIRTGTNGKPANQYANPYTATYDGLGTGFDLSWAVDAQENPVAVDSVHYVKIASAAMINSSSNSTNHYGNVTAMVKNISENNAVVGVTRAPKSILIDGKEIELEDGKNESKL